MPAKTGKLRAPLGKTRESIVDIARECIGTPFRKHGRLVGLGLDCAGVVIHVGNTLSFVDNYDFRDYGWMPDRRAVGRELSDNLVRIQTRPLHIGSLLCMGGTHICVVTPCKNGLNGFGILHSSILMGAVKEHGLDDYWMRKITSAWDFRGVED